LDCKTIDKSRARLLLRASREAGCKIALVRNRMLARNLSDENKQKILKDLKKVAISSPYHYVDYYIAEWYLRGWGGEEKKNQAVVWFEKAIHKGNTDAMYNLGVCYDNGGLGLTQSDTEAIELFALAADKGHATARFNLGNSYRIGSGDLAIDFNRCVELWEQSSKQGLVEAQHNLASMYCSGSGDGSPMTIPVNPQLCFKWNLAAAKQGNVIAMSRIGDAYDDGDGVDHDAGSAFEWYMKAAEMGDLGAQFAVGHFLEHGIGLDIDLVQAMFWYQKAAAQGDQQAIGAVEHLYAIEVFSD